MTFVSLIKFTEAGLRDIKQTTSRTAAFKKSAKAGGIKVSRMLWLSGRYDGLIIFDAVDAETASAVMLQLCMLGNVSTETMLAFDSGGIEQVISKLE